MSELDVESEIYQRLYGLPRREREEDGSPEHRIVIDDRDLAAASPVRDASAVPPAPARGPRPAAADLAGFARDLVREAGAVAARGAHRLVGLTHSGEHLARPGAARLGSAGRAAAAAGAIALARARRTLSRVRHPVARLVAVAAPVRAAARRDPAPTAAIASALLAVPILALLLSSSAARSVPARLKLDTPARLPITSAPAPAVRPRPAHRSQPPPTVSTDQAPAAIPTDIARRPSSTTTKKPASTVRHRSTSRPRRRAAAPRPSPPPIRKRTTHERPAHSPPATLTPTTPSTPTTPGGTPSNVTGGQGAPTG